MSQHIYHPYHLVDPSPWPLASAGAAFFLVTGFLNFFHTTSFGLLFLSLSLLILIAAQWWRDVSREGAALGLHTKTVELGLRGGILLFICSEVLFFLSFFWAFFHLTLSPAIEIGATSPPVGLAPLAPFRVPLLNTVILLSSGVSVTWAHHALIKGAHSDAVQALVVTAGLGLYFTTLQALEYWETFFRMADACFGSCFFLATGFHGFHVVVGTLFLLVCLTRVVSAHFRTDHHFGFEAAAWYWHFVDVVWLFLFVTVYWWGGAFRGSI